MQSTLKFRLLKIRYGHSIHLHLKKVFLDNCCKLPLTLQIVDEKSLIKKYQNEIRSLKEELDQLKSGIVTVPQLKHTGGDDIVILKQKVPSSVIGPYICD